MTYSDYAALPDDGKRHELYDGELVVLTSPALHHQRAIRHLVGILDRHVRTQNLGEVIPAPFDVILSETTVVQPDIVFVARDRARTLRIVASKAPPRWRSRSCRCRRLAATAAGRRCCTRDTAGRTSG